MTPTIVLITGLSATGKTTLARRVAAEFALPAFLKDDFKEAMLENLCPDGDYETIDREQHSLVGRLSFMAMATALEATVWAGRTGIFEGNFDRSLFSPILASIYRRYPFEVIQAHVVCREDVRLTRFVEREKDGSRHPSHQGLRFLGTAQTKLDEPLDLPSGQTFRIDATEPEAAGLEPFLRAVANLRRAA